MPVVSPGYKRRRRRNALVALAGLGLVASGLFSSPAAALPFSFSTGSPDGKMAMASRPGSGGAVEIEAGDDFVLADPTTLTSATFTGLLPSGALLSSIQEVRVKAYRAFPADSDVTRTSGAPLFSTSLVPARLDSPADVAFAQGDSADGSLSFTASLLDPLFTAQNSVLNGIHPKPNQLTGGEGSVTGEEVAFNVTFSSPLSFAAGHYFFVPQVALSSGDFFWLSAAGGPFPPESTDFEAWIRNASLDPDWLRVGTDIVGGPTHPKFNAAFGLTGTRCPPLSILPAGLPPATAGNAYSVSLTASGGVPPYSFGESGTLPSGVSLATGGTLSGAPAQAGSFPITVAVADADGCKGTADVTLTVRTPGSTAGPPDTKISKAKINSKRRKATFKFKAIGAATGFQCALAKDHRKPRLKTCRSPKTYMRLKAGRYSFEVRALSSAGSDLTPAKRQFKIGP
jgi:hypothetical protein